jgi:hypothetical protein
MQCAQRITANIARQLTGTYLERSASPDAIGDADERHRAPMVRATILHARIFAVGALLLAFTADLRASPPHDPFGALNVALSDASYGGVAATWRDELARMASDQDAMTACAGESAPDCGAALRLIAIVEEARRYQGRALFGHINRAINLLLRPTPGAWLSPLEVLRLREADCKGYALAKYFALRQAGVRPERLRLVIVHDKRRASDHMVVAVYEGGSWLILDNGTMILVNDVDAAAIYSPLFVLDHTGTRRYILPAG